MMRTALPESAPQSLWRLPRVGTPGATQLAPVLAAGLLAVVVGLHALSGFNPAFEALYLAPVFLAFRWSNPVAGFGITLLSAVCASLANADRLTPAGLALRLCAFVAFAGICLWTSRRMDGWERDAFGGRSESTPTVAVQIDCDGFEQLDALYGAQSGNHVLGMLVKTGRREYAVVLGGLDTASARKLMGHVRQQFEQMVDDAGYECSISFGYSPVAAQPTRIRDLLRQSNPDLRGAYLN